MRLEEENEQLLKEKEKPTLSNSGTRIKTHKRNIAAPLDPASFSDAMVQIYLDNDGDLELVARNLESLDLTFSRDGDTFFEVARGAHTQPDTIKLDEGECHPCLRISTNSRCYFCKYDICILGDALSHIVSTV